MIVGAAIIPSAPLLVAGVAPGLPDGVGKVCDAVDTALEHLPEHDVTLLIAAADPGGPSGQGLYDGAEATLAGCGRPDIALRAEVDREAIEAITRVTQYPMYRGDALPLDLSVLALLHGAHARLVPVAVPTGASFDALTSVGTGIADAVDGDARVVVVAAGDLSAGLTPASPLSEVEGARAFDDQVVDIVDSGRLGSLARLGPDEAERVGARGWAPLAVLHGIVARAKVGMVVRHYSAPKGVGYLVANGG